MNLWRLKCSNIKAVGTRVAVIVSEVGSHFTRLFDGSGVKPGCVLHEPDSLTDAETEIASMVPPAMCFQSRIFMTGKKEKKKISGYLRNTRGRK